MYLHGHSVSKDCNYWFTTNPNPNPNITLTLTLTLVHHCPVGGGGLVQHEIIHTRAFSCTIYGRKRLAALWPQGNSRILSDTPFGSTALSVHGIYTKETLFVQ